MNEIYELQLRGGGGGNEEFIINMLAAWAYFKTRGPFPERPDNLTGPKSYFEIKISRKVGCVLTSNEVHFVSLADNFIVQFSNLLKLPSKMGKKQSLPGASRNGPRKRNTINWQKITVLFVFEMSVTNIGPFQEYSHPARSNLLTDLLLQTFPRIFFPQVKASENLCQVSLVPRAFFALGQYQELEPSRSLLVVSFSRSFSSPDAALLLVSTKNRDLWEDPTFWSCAELSSRILSQSACAEWLEVRESRTSGVGPSQRSQVLGVSTDAMVWVVTFKFKLQYSTINLSRVTLTYQWKLTASKMQWI